MIRGVDPPAGPAFDWAVRTIDLQTQTRGELPVNSLPPGVMLNFADGERPSGAVDGVNKVFTLVHVPTPPDSLVLSNNGLIQVGEGNDFTLLVNVITFAVAPVAGAAVLASYRY